MNAYCIRIYLKTTPWKFKYIQQKYQLTFRGDEVLFLNTLYVFNFKKWKHFNDELQILHYYDHLPVYIQIYNGFNE